MKDVESAKEELARAILHSEEYLNYKRCEAKLRLRPDVFNQANDIRRQLFALQNEEGITDVYGMLEGIKNNSRDMMFIEELNEFILAECALSRMIQEVMERLVRDIDIDLSFWE